mmetsp:Transcript_28057/g.71735  ORF Transcript_28057/g.71735 Transcript_28057/m.71735 type:complete len:80 (+) Transcript_28057:1045-1284(+)
MPHCVVGCTMCSNQQHNNTTTRSSSCGGGARSLLAAVAGRGSGRHDLDPATPHGARPPQQSAPSLSAHSGVKNGARASY